IHHEDTLAIAVCAFGYIGCHISPLIVAEGEWEFLFCFPVWKHLDKIDARPGNDNCTYPVVNPAQFALLTITRVRTQNSDVRHLWHFFNIQFNGLLIRNVNLQCNHSFSVQMRGLSKKDMSHKAAQSNLIPIAQDTRLVRDQSLAVQMSAIDAAQIDQCKGILTACNSRVNAGYTFFQRAIRRQVYIRLLRTGGITSAKYRTFGG